MSPEYTDTDLDVAQGKPRPKGTLPHLTADRRPEFLKSWLTRALRPPEGWHVETFDRYGREARDPACCSSRTGASTPATDSGNRKTSHEPRAWRSSRRPMAGSTSPPNPGRGRRRVDGALSARLGLVRIRRSRASGRMARMFLPVAAASRLQLDTRPPIRRAHGDTQAGTFGKGDALSHLAPERRPTLCATPDAVRRSSKRASNGCAPASLPRSCRWVLGVEPLAHSTLRARLREIGVVARRFEDWGGCHPKLGLYN